ncbi:MAG TPA: hypothetical protein VLW85_14720 [Myxococcales bacterium]|nr:hypothetical protein [Myxococcales bacterium]
MSAIASAGIQAGKPSRHTSVERRSWLRAARPCIVSGPTLRPPTPAHQTRPA